jgi:hypothetical protein
MTNPIMGYPTATTAFTLGGGNYVAEYPRTNLQTDDLAQVARTPDLQATSTFFYGQTNILAVQVGVIGLFGVNFTPSAHIRLRYWSDAAMATTPLLDTGNVPVFSGGRLSDPHWFFWNGTNYNIRAFRIDISDPTNLAGYLDIGRLEIAFAYETGFGMAQGAQRGRLMRTAFSQTPGGMKFFSPYPSPRVLKATFDANDPEMADFYLEILRVYDLFVPFIVIPEPDDSLRWNQSAMLARLTQASPMASYVDFFRSQISLDFEQVL